jgi:O-antigen/teichoic acid export membrane protein
MTNFVTTFALARSVSASEFGNFALLYSILLFCNSMQLALLTQPHNVLGVEHQGSTYRLYTTSIAVGQLTFAAVAAGTAFLAALVASARGSEWRYLLVAVGLLVFCWQLQEFVRRVLYTEGRLSGALLNDICSYGGQMLIVLALWRMDRLCVSSALYAIALTSGISAALGIWQLRRSFALGLSAAMLAGNLRFGRWLAAGMLGYWISDQTYILLSAMLLGKDAVGTMMAVHLIFGPSRILSGFLDSILATWFARTLAEGGKRSLDAALRQVQALSAITMGGYCVFAAVLATPILASLYGSKYNGSEALVVLYAIFMLASQMSTVLAGAMKALRLPAEVSKGYAVTSVMAVSLAWPLIQLWNINGAVLGMILTPLAVIAIYSRAYRRWSQRPSVPSESSASPTVTTS